MATLPHRGLSNYTPTDPHFRSIPAAGDLVGCSYQTIYRISRRGDLTIHYLKEHDSLGRRHLRPAVREDDILSLFVERPAPGCPIELPKRKGRPGKFYFLREDAYRRFGISHALLSYWSDRKSKRRKGKALRVRWFYLISERERGPWKRRMAWDGQDLQDIADGLEGHRPWSGRGTWGTRHRQERNQEANNFVSGLPLPMWASDVRSLARRARLTMHLLYRAKKKLKVLTTYTQERPPQAYWHLAGQGVPGSSPAVPSPPTPAEAIPDYGGISNPPPASKMVLPATRTHDITQEAADKIAQRVRTALEAGEADEEGYVPAKTAKHGTALELPYLSKLCYEGGPIKFKRKGQRLWIHAADLLRFVYERDQQKLEGE